jgi:predicted HicB family RNase H-like nuclease
VLSDGATAEEAVKKVLSLKDEVIEADYKRGLKIPEPREEIEYSGRFLLRVPKSLHRDLAEEAERDGTSINRFVIQVLSAALERRKTLATVAESIKAGFDDALKAAITAWLGGRQEISPKQHSEVVYRKLLNKVSFSRDAMITYRTPTKERSEPDEEKITVPLTEALRRGFSR